MGDKKEFQGWLPNWSGISVEIIILKQSREIDIETDLSPQAIENYGIIGGLTPGIVPYAFFKVKDAHGALVTEFDPKLKIRVRYTAEAWQHVIDLQGGSGPPEVFFLEKFEDNWKGNWVPFTVDPGDVHPPPDPYSFGYIDIYVSNLPDPNIGGPGD